MDINHNKTGGRKKGVGNRTTTMTKGIIADLLAEYHSTGKLSEDFKKLEPKDRIICAEKLMQYIMPKMQSTSIDFAEGNTKVSIEQTLKELSIEQ